MRISVLNPRQTLWQGRASQALLPTEDGEICVLDFHQPFLVRLGKGTIRLGEQILKQAPLKKISVSDGVARMRGNELLILIES